LFVILAQELQVVCEQALSKMHFANCVALAAVMVTTFIENLRHYSSDDRAGSRTPRTPRSRKTAVLGTPFRLNNLLCLMQNKS